MAEIGIDVTSQRSENIRDFADTALNVVVTVCGHAHETCPIFPVNCKVVHSGFPDPPKMAKELAKGSFGRRTACVLQAGKRRNPGLCGIPARIFKSLSF